MSVDSQVKEERPPYVQFERRAVEDKAKSQELGHYVAVDVDFVCITPAYTKDRMVHTAEKWFAKIKAQANAGRFNPAWIKRFEDQYAAWKNGQELPLDGTPIRGWSVISPAQQETLINMKILTVEDAAQMNDDAIRRVGMGGAEVRNKAQAALKASKDGGKLVMENAELRAKLEVSELNVKKLSSDLEELAAYVRANMPQAVEPQATAEITASDLIDEPEKPRRGRPPKG